MIELINVSKYYPTDFGRHYLFRDVSLVLPLDKSVAVIGPNGAGKSTFLRLLGGADIPSEGRIVKSGRISPPMGLTPGLQPSLTGVENARFAGRIHGMTREEILDLIDHVRELSDIGKFFDMPVGTYSAGMKQRVAFAINMAMEYDYYLFDEIGAGGDKEFRKTAKALVQERLKTSNFLIVSHRTDELIDICDAGIVIKDGTLTYYDTITDALAAYNTDDDEGSSRRQRRRKRREKGEAAEAAEAGTEQAAGEQVTLADPAAESRKERRRRRKAEKEAALAAAAGSAAPPAEESPASEDVREERRRKRKARKEVAAQAAETGPAEPAGAEAEAEEGRGKRRRRRKARQREEEASPELAAPAASSSADSPELADAASAEEAVDQRKAARKRRKARLADGEAASETAGEAHAGDPQARKEKRLARKQARKLRKQDQAEFTADGVASDLAAGVEGAAIEENLAQPEKRRKRHARQAAEAEAGAGPEAVKPRRKRLAREPGVEDLQALRRGAALHQARAQTKSARALRLLLQHLAQVTAEAKPAEASRLALISAAQDSASEEARLARKQLIGMCKSASGASPRDMGEPPLELPDAGIPPVKLQHDTRPGHRFV
jgi:capsular polysaccharide transport system ATP-binding protein